MLTSKVPVVVVIEGWHRAAFRVWRMEKIELSAPSTAQFCCCRGTALKKPVPEQ
jgi:hypothetical protein